MAFTITVTSRLDFDEAVAATREALSDEGFGVLTEIDLAATLRAKTGAELPPFLILGACRPPLAEAAVKVDPAIATLLPCSVVVRRQEEQTVIEAMDPGLIAQVTGQPALEEVAADAAGRIGRALAAVAAK